ncbi:MAG: PIN domain-containing protein [Actinobacteria bacterium]|nr:PIN domain-containing protein [Cyanobacteriota bacterium]MCL5771032.1 PIN domain-containing protein [Actinomycetota bacterium]
MSVFIDASAFYALLNKNDNFHNEAIIISSILSKNNEHLITSNYTLAETYTVLRSKMGYDIASKFANEIKKNLIEIIWVDEIIHNRGLEVFLEKKEPEDLSFFDCIDFALMESAGIEKAFSFDRHFKILGITLVESQIHLNSKTSN